jgi:ligand-binding sensor domain-containing protein/signal transduction histidine kinase
MPRYSGPKQMAHLCCLMLLNLSSLVTAPPAAAEDFASNIEFITIGDAKKIPENVASSLAQDREGFLWIGTAAGLVRYDGYRFRLFSKNHQDPKSLSGNFIRDILPLPDGTIWVGTEPGGVSVFDPNTETFTRIYDQEQLLNRPYLSSVSSLAQDNNGYIWLGTKKGLIKMDPANKSETHYEGKTQHKLLHNDVRALLTDNSGRLWVGSRGGLNYYNSAEDKFEVVQIGPGLDTRMPFVRTLFMAEDGRIWIGTDSLGVFILNPQEMTIQPALTGIEAQDNNDAVNTIAQINKNEIWVGRFSGIDRIDANSGRWLQRIVPDPSDPNSLANNDIRALLKDKSGQVWLAGYGAGVQRLQQQGNGIKVLRYSLLNTHSLTDPNVSSLLVLDDGNIWIGTRGNGIDIYQPDEGVVGGYRVQQNVAGALDAGWITAMTQDQQGQLWVAANPGKLYRFDPEQDHFIAYTQEQGLINANIRVLHPSADGNLWIGTNQGLVRWSALENTFSKINFADGTAMLDGINALKEDKEGNLWIATGASGLYKVEHGTSELQHIKGRIDNAFDLRITSIVGMLIDSKQGFWLDTPDGLMSVTNWLSATEVELSNISRQFGYGGNPFGANLLEDKQGRIWSPRFIFDPKQMQITELQHADGNDFGTPWFRSFAQTQQGAMLFGGSKGLLIIEPDKFKPWEFQPPVVATELRINGKTENMALLHDVLTLHPGQQSFSIEFAALDLSAPQLNMYMYKLEGFDSDWIATDSSRRSASYSNLWPGNYVLKIRGSNRNGDWSDEELTIKVKVIARYWQSPWFLLLLIIVAAAIIYLGVTLRTKFIMQRGKELENLVAQRTSELRRTQATLIEQEKMASLGSLVAGISHEINTPIGIAVTAASTLDDATKALVKMFNSEKLTRSGLQRYVEHISESVRLLSSSLDRAEQLIGSFKQVAVDQSSEHRRKIILDKFLKDSSLALQSLLKKKHAQLSIVCEEEIEMDSYPGALFQILSNLVNNSLTHGFTEDGAGKITIEVSSQQDHVVLRYVDNGMGMSAEVQKMAFEPFFTTTRGSGGSGLGLHLVYNFVTQLLGGTIELMPASDSGFSCQLKLPKLAPEQINKKPYQYN